MGIGLSCFGNCGRCFGQSKTSKDMNPEVEEHIHKLKRDKECSTLEEWLIASPATLNKNMSSNNGGEFVVFRQSSKKIHPSSLGAHNAESSSDPRNSLSKERLLNEDEGHGKSSSVCGDDTPILCRSSSGKGKKKVSFRLPEETDIFVFHSSEEELEE